MRLIVKQKITEQANTLKMVDKAYIPLERLAENVKAGDPENLEAQAAQTYWQLLFGNKVISEENFTHSG